MDLSEQKSSQTVIQIHIIDINDNAPVFYFAEYNTQVKEDVKIHSLVYTITAVDADEPNTDNSKITYEMSTSSHNKLFRIDSHSGDIMLNASLREHVGNYTILITAKDHGDPQLYGTTILNVEVKDVNLNAPVLVAKPAGNLVKISEVSIVQSSFKYIGTIEISSRQDSSCHIRLIIAPGREANGDAL